MKEPRQAVYKTPLDPTPFGPVEVIWHFHGEIPKVVRVIFSKPDLPADKEADLLFPQARPDREPVIDRFIRDLHLFLEGRDVAFSLDILEWSQCSPFQRSVLIAEYGIPRGRVSTYRFIADHLGNAKGARAVGNALAKNPFPLVVPCHRAIRSDGSLGGFQGGIAMKRRLLEMEGVSFNEAGKVLSPRWFYDNGM